MIVQKEALTRALRLLDAAKCQYAVIDADGVKHGDLDVAVKVKQKRNHPPGSYLQHHQALTEKMSRGDAIVVPFGPFDGPKDRESLRSSISAYCSRTWGAGTYITAMNGAGIEVLRIE